MILKEFYFKDGGKGRSAYFDDYARRYTDLPLLVVLKEKTLPDGRTASVPALPVQFGAERLGVRLDLPKPGEHDAEILGPLRAQRSDAAD